MFYVVEYLILILVTKVCFATFIESFWTPEIEKLVIYSTDFEDLDYEILIKKSTKGSINP